MAKAKFLVDGKEFDADPPTPRQIEIKKLLDSMRDEVVTIQELGKRIGPINPDTLRDFGHRFHGYTYKSGIRFYYGSREAVKKFKRLIETSRRRRKS